MTGRNIAEIVSHYISVHANGRTLVRLAEQLREAGGNGSDTSLSAWATGRRPPRDREDVKKLRLVVQCQHDLFGEQAIEAAMPLDDPAVPRRPTGRTRASATERSVEPDPVIRSVRYPSPRLPRLADSYQNRPEQQALKEVLDAGRAAVLVQDGPLATGVLAGTGGVGKTQIARAYARTVWDDPTLTVAAWVDAGSRQSIENGYAEVALRITGRAGREPKQAADDLIEWLQATDQKWLVVLDGLHNTDDLMGLWPPDTPTGRLIVTTRDQAPSLWKGNRYLIPVDVFSHAQAETYLRDQLSTNSRLIDGASELAETLGRHPLALAHAAAVMLARQWTAGRYRREFLDESKKLSDLDPRSNELMPDDKYRDTIATTWRISIEHADDQPPKHVARQLLAIASLLDPNGIPARLFSSQAVIEYLSRTLDRATSPDDVCDGLALLSRFSLVTADLNEPAARVYVHSLVQRAALDDPDSPALELITLVAADALVQTWPDEDGESEEDGAIDADLVHVLHSNAAILDQRVGTSLMRPETGCHALLTRVGHSIGRLGRPHAARTYFQELAVRATEAMGHDHLDTLKIRRHAASALGYTRDWVGALGEFSALCQDYHQIAGDDHLDALEARTSRASYQAMTGDVAGAISELEAVLEVRRQLQQYPFHPDVLTTRARLAKWRGHSGQIAEAIASLESVLVDYREHHRDEARAIFLTRASLATWRGNAGEAAAAAAVFQDLLQDRLRTRGPDHPETISTRVSLVHWYRAAKNWAAARDARRELVAEQRRLLDDFERRYGADHPDTLAWRASLLVSHPARGSRLAGAISAMKVLVASQERILSPQHPAVLGSRLKLASLVGGSGDPVGAVNELQDVLDISVQGLSLTHPLTLRTLAKLASWQARAGDPAEAVRTLQTLLARQRQVQAPAAYISTTLSNLILHHQADGNWLGVGETIVALLSHQATTLPPEHPDILRSRLRLAVWRAKSGQAATAVDELRRIAEDYTRVLGRQHRDTMRAQLELGRWLWESGHHREGRQTLTTLLNDQRTCLGVENRWTLATGQTLRSWQPGPEQRRASQSYRPVQRFGGQSSQAANGEPTTARMPNSVPDKFEVDRVEGLTVKMNGSRAWDALLEALALAFEPGLPRDVWTMMANTLSATVLVDGADIDELLAETSSYIKTDVDEGVAVYRLANPDLARQVLSLAAQRTGLDGDLDTTLRHRQVSEALIMQFPLSRYVFVHLPRHAAAGGRLHHLAWNPPILDHIDLATLTEEVLRGWFGAAALPNEIAGTLQVRHLLADLPPGDRAVVRGMVTTPSSRAGRRFAGRKRPGRLAGASTPVWTLGWARQDRDPHHVTLTGKPTRSRYRERDDEILALTPAGLSDHSGVLAVGSRAGAIGLWDVGTGRQSIDIKIAGNLVDLEPVAINDVALLAVIGEETVQAWNLADRSWHGEPVSGFDGGIQAATKIRYRGVATLLVLIEGSGHIVLWDPETGDIAGRSIARHNGQVRGVCSFPSRRTSGDCIAVAGSEGFITTWETDPLRLTDITVGGHNGSITSVTTIRSQRNAVLCTGGKDGRIGFWDPYNGGQVHPRFIRAHRGAVLALTPVIRSGARANLASAGEDDTVRLWNIENGRRIGAPLTGHTARVRALATPILTNGRTTIASSGHDRSVRVWDLQEAWQLDRARNPDKAGRPRNLADDSGCTVTAITSGRLGEDQGLHLVTGRRNGSIQLHDPASGAPVGEPVQAHTSGVRIMTELPMRDGTSRVATVGGDNKVKIWDFTSAHPVAELPPPAKGEVRVLTAVRRHGRDMLLAIGDSTGRIQLWNPSGRQDVRSIDAHTKPVASMVSVELDYRTTRLVTGGHDFKIKFWDPDSEEHDDGLDIVKNSNPIYAMALLPSANGPVLAAGGHENRGRIRLYEVSTRRALTGLSVRSGDILMNALASVTTANGNPLLIGVGRQSAIRVWRPDTAEVVHRLDIEGPIIASHAFGTHLALSTARGLYQLNLTFAG